MPESNSNDEVSLSYLTRICRNGFDKNNSDYDELRKAFSDLQASYRDEKHRVDSLHEHVRRITEMLEPQSGDALKIQLAIINSKLTRSHERHDETGVRLLEVKTGLSAEIVAAKMDLTKEIVSVKADIDGAKTKFLAAALSALVALATAVGGFVWSRVEKGRL